MPEIVQFIPGDSGFDSEAIAVVCTAYDRASHMLHDRGHARVAREIIAKRIIALAAKGERDPERLGNSAPVAAGLRR